MQISNLSQENSKYPDKLRHFDGNPQSLNVLGTLSNSPTVAIVGMRKATSYGKQATYMLARELASAGVTIVSGLAEGIDGVAHQAALDAGGHTVAVLAHGLDRIYPLGHRDLAKSILAGGGALVSEYNAGMPPLPQNFIARNRIISGLSDITIVTEAGVKSGALWTAHFALDQNRLVMALPGNIYAATSAGPNNLLREGAAPVTSATDVMLALGYDADTKRSNNAKEMVLPTSPSEAKLLELMQTGSATSDTLIEASGLSAAEFANVMSLMEITGKVRNLGAGLWAARGQSVISSRRN